MFEFFLKSTSGRTIGGPLFCLNGASAGQAWNGSALTTLTNSLYPSMAIAMTEITGTGIYQASMPGSLSQPGRYAFVPAIASGASFTASDTPIGFNAGDSLNCDWSGSKALSLADALNLGSGSVPISSATIPNSSCGNLVYTTPSGVGIGGAQVDIYYSTDWPTNPGNVQASGSTNQDGSWGPLYIRHGTYVAVFSKQGVSGPDVSPVIVV